MKKNTKQVKKKMYLKDNLQLLSLALPTIILLGVFCYWPMFGVILAFKDYKVPKGIFGSPWAGFKNFEFFFQSQDAWRVTRNTLALNFMFIAVGIICGVVFALIMFEVKKAGHVKVYQTVSIIPSFLSWVAVGYIVYALLDPGKGIVNQILVFFGMEKIPWYSEAKYWPLILLLSKIWQSVGLGSIIYYAALMGVDAELYEAAEIDGAGRLKKTWYVSIPQIVPIIIIQCDKKRRGAVPHNGRYRYLCVQGFDDAGKYRHGERRWSVPVGCVLRNANGHEPDCEKDIA